MLVIDDEPIITELLATSPRFQGFEIATASSPEKVIGRLRVILRRTGLVPKHSATRLVVADIELDEDSHEAWKGGQPVSLTPTEFTLLLRPEQDR